MEGAGLLSSGFSHSFPGGPGFGGPGFGGPGFSVRGGVSLSLSYIEPVLWVGAVALIIVASTNSGRTARVTVNGEEFGDAVVEDGFAVIRATVSAAMEGLSVDVVATIGAVSVAGTCVCVAADLHGLWDPNDQATLTTDTGISVVEDKSGSGNDLTQSTASAQPELVEDAYNGMAVLRYDGVDDSIGKAFSCSQPTTAICVTRVLTSVTYGRIIGSFTGPGTWIFNYNARMGSYFGSLNTWLLVDDGPTLTDTNVLVCNTTAAGTDSMFMCQDAELTGVDVGTTYAPNGIRLASQAGTANFLNVDIGVVVLVDGTLTSDELSAVVAAYAESYGV